MSPEDALFVPDWLRIAEKDLGRSENMLGLEDGGAAGFFLQQAVEKFLKAFLLLRGWQLQRTHDLEVLLNHALTHDPSLEPFRAVCQKISAFYVAERYPPAPEDAVTEEDVRTSLEEVRPLIDYLRRETG